MLLAGERRIEGWRAGLRDGTFKGLSFVDLSHQDRLRSAGEYAYANAAVSYLVDTFGAAKFWELYRDFKEYDPGGEPEVHPLEQLLADATHRLLRRIYNIDERELDARTREYIQRSAA